MNEERTWTGNSEVDAAIVMLDRIDCSPKNNSRIDAVETTLRRLYARNQELEARLQKLQSYYDAVGAGGVSAQRITQVAPQPQADTRDAERWGSEPVTGTPFLQEKDQHLLDRFIETTEDNEGFDIGKEAIKRLANLGVVESLGFGRYGVTMFGYWVHEHYWCQNPSLPLKTNLDRDADARAAIAKATGGAP